MSFEDCLTREQRSALLAKYREDREREGELIEDEVRIVQELALCCDEQEDEIKRLTGEVAALKAAQGRCEKPDEPEFFDT